VSDVVDDLEAEHVQLEAPPPCAGRALSLLRKQAAV
jgi:hypothetical protein